MKIKSFLKEDQKVHSKLSDAKESSDQVIKKDDVEVTSDETPVRIIEESTSAKRVKYESPLDFQNVSTISEDKYENCCNINFSTLFSNHDCSLKIIITLFFSNLNNSR
jgi:hypothetical protein